MPESAQQPPEVPTPEPGVAPAGENLPSGTVTYRHKKTKQLSRYSAPIAVLERSDAWERQNTKA